MRGYLDVVVDIVRRSEGHAARQLEACRVTFKSAFFNKNQNLQRSLRKKSSMNHELGTSSSELCSQ